jgi:hypothetical protein
MYHFNACLALDKWPNLDATLPKTSAGESSNDRIAFEPADIETAPVADEHG